MKKPKVAIVDYGVGNLLSVLRAIDECGGEPITSSDSEVIIKADRVILPGVGAFANGMKALESLGLIETLKELANRGTPLLGICLGMQLLLNESEEHGLTKGLGLIPGRVVPIINLSANGLALKIPHIGWSQLVPHEEVKWGNSLLKKTNPGDAVYFVHSYMAVPANSNMTLAFCVYGGNLIPAVIGKGNIIGCQFHPEKSGDVGLNIINEFIHNNRYN